MSVSTTMKLLSALMIIGVLSEAKSRRLGNGQSRIMNGHPVDIEDYPYMVKLVIGVSPELYRCGGALITSQTVLTAAHCVLDSNSQPRNVMVSIEVTGEMIAASSIIPHEEYINNSSLMHPYDIAVIYLESPSTYAYGFPVLNHEQHLQAPGTIIEIVGYGVTETNDEPNYLSGTKTQIFRVSNMLESSHVFSVYNEAGGGACSGDSGSPAIVRNGTEHIIIGVASGGHLINGSSKCTNEPQIYTSVSGYYAWIMNRIEETNY